MVTTCGGGSTLVGGSTIGGLVSLGVGSTLGGWAGRGVFKVAAGFQAPKRSRSLAMASSWSWCAVAGASFMAHEINLRAWLI